MEPGHYMRTSRGVWGTFFISPDLGQNLVPPGSFGQNLVPPPEFGAESRTSPGQNRVPLMAPKKQRHGKDAVQSKDAVQTQVEVLNIPPPPPKKQRHCKDAVQTQVEVLNIPPPPPPTQPLPQVECANSAKPSQRIFSVTVNLFGPTRVQWKFSAHKSASCTRFMPLGGSGADHAIAAARCSSYRLVSPARNARTAPRGPTAFRIAAVAKFMLSAPALARRP